jgi:hypothetical protein
MDIMETLELGRSGLDLVDFTGSWQTNWRSIFVQASVHSFGRC